ncbi:MAG: phospholipid carrier-dependent glycosyltransferase [Chloroflexi bacterium]|nr:MAG: phospholipid carrier-dependent glycosyltransferase [Chloroflexota bacterium]
MSIKDSSFVRDRILTGISSTRQILVDWRSWDRATVARLLGVMVVVVVAVGLRVWGLNQLGYNTDEAVYAGQGAAIARAPILKDIFPIFRAHPLLFQFLLALVFTFGVSDLAGRLLAVTIGLAAVYMTYRVGKLLYGQKAGLLAGLFFALMPYHVVVSRQVLLDGPLVFFTTLTLFFLARYAMTNRPAWIYLTGVGMGLTFLAKETGIILLGSIYAFLALSREIPVRLKELAFSTVLMILMIAPFPLSLLLAGGTRSGQNYLIWQLFRRPNHTWDFYATTVPQAIGYLVIIAAILGLWFLRHERSWRERLLLSWIIVPTVFFQIWPTKGFQYLLPIAPAIAVLAGRAIVHWWRDDISVLNKGNARSWIKTGVVGVIALSLLFSSIQLIRPATSGTFLAGTGGVPGGREAGAWLKENVPQGSTLMTIGPSMANILQFYGHRKALGLSVSPNPLRRNPSYPPILNPDLQIRNGDIQYVVWDSYSAERSAFFSEGVLRYVQRYHGRAIHTQSVMVELADGTTIAKPVIIIYEVRP